MDNYNFDSIFASGDDYKPSYLRDVSRTHFFFNDAYSEEEDTGDDRYKGLFSRKYQEEIEQRSKQLGYSNKEQVVRESIFNKASFNLTNRLLGNTSNIYSKVFSSFSTPDLFDNPDQDAEYGRDLLHDFSNFLVGERSEREAENIIPIMRAMDSEINQAVNRDIENSISGSASVRRDIENFQRKAWNTEATIDNLTGGSYTRANKLLNRIQYSNDRPSVLPDLNSEASEETSELLTKIQEIDTLKYYSETLSSYVEEIDKLDPSEQEESGLLRHREPYNITPHEQQLDKLRLVELYFKLNSSKGSSKFDLNSDPNSKEKAVIDIETELTKQLVYNSVSVDNNEATVNTSSEDNNINYNKLLANGYITRPGVLPAVGLLYDAKNKLTVSLYQLQNLTVLDYYTDNLIRRAEEFSYNQAEFEKNSDRVKPTPFTFNLTLAYNTEKSNSDVGYNILGPNLAAIRRFQRLKEMYPDALDININVSDRKNHTKLLVSDNQAYISTQNQTNPVGKSIHQSGANYEAGLVLQYREDPKTLGEEADNKLFYQVKAVESLLEKLPEQGKLLQTGQSNISGPVETYEMMRASMQYLEENKTSSKADFILDQVFLLQYDSLLFDEQKKGEMGPESSELLKKYDSDLTKKQRKYQEEIQKPLMMALIEDRAFVQTDVRNYKKNVQDPIFKYLIENQPEYAASGYNLSKFLNIDKTQSTQGKISQLMRDRNISESMAIQLLAMNSGNIQTANVPRQHVKGSILYEVDEFGLPKVNQEGIPISLGGELSSSNRGVYSVAIKDSKFERSITSNELGIMQYSEGLKAYFDQNKIKSSENNLNNLEQQEKLDEFSEFYFKAKEDIKSQKVGSLQGGNRPGYEKQTDRLRLIELYLGLKSVKDKTKSMMDISLEYDSQGPIALQVDLGNNLKYNFSPQLSGTGDDPGFIFETNKSKVIGFSEFINQSSKDITTGFIREGDSLQIKAGERATLTPIETTISMLTSIALEAEQIKLVKAPLIEYQNMFAPDLEGNERLPGAIANYLLTLANSAEVSGSILDPNKVTKASLIEGSYNNLQARLSNANPELDKIRQIAGIDIYSEERQANLTYLTKLVQVFANASIGDREKMLTGEGMQGANSLHTFLPNLLKSPEYADLLYDFVTSQNDPLYNKNVTTHMNEVSTRVYDPYLYKTQVSTYGSTQAYRQKVLYGVTDRRSNVVDSINNASETDASNLTGLAAFALASSPFEHDATSDLGIGDLLFLPITGTGGSREKTGLEYKGYSNYEALHPYFQHKKIGIGTDLKLIQDTGVGTILSVNDLEEYKESILHLGEQFSDQVIEQTREAFKGNERLVMFNFDVAKKASQIPQRIKNVIGSRPTIELTTVYQELLEKGKSLHQGFNLTSEVNTSVELQASYLEDLKSKLPRDKQHLVDESFGIGALAGSQIRSVLSDDIAKVLESIRQEIETEFGVDTRDRDIGTELFRAKLVYLDNTGSGQRGFTGSSKRDGDSVMLFQLGGAYSDYSFLNPLFGGESGMRTGFLDRAVKGHQASKLSANSQTSDGNFDLAKEMLIQSGDTFREDPGTNRVYQYRYNPLTGQHERQRVVDNKKEFTIYENIIEKVSQDPSMSTLRATSNAASFNAEYAIEDLKDVRILEGKVQSNEIRTEIEFFRTKVHGGGGRQESLTGGLFKMVPIYLYDQSEEEPGLLRNLLDQFNTTRSGSFRGDGREVQFEQFYGIVNPSNMKSYFYEHGSEILIDSAKKEGLLKNEESNNKKLAASLLMAFGVDKFGKQSVSDTAIKALAEAASSNELGTYFKDQFIATVISENTTDATEIGKSFIKGAVSDSKLQVRTLEYIGLDLIERTLKGDYTAGQELNTKLQTLLSDPTNSAVQTEYTNIGTSRGREMSILAASLDFFVQLADAKVSDIAVVNTTKDMAAYKSLGTIGGISYDELIDPENREDLQTLTNFLARKSYLVGMNMSVDGSQSKVAISSKLESFIENQHIIWEPFYTDAKKFKEGGSLSSLRHLMAGFFGSMSGGFTGEFLDSTKGIQQIDLLGNYARGSIFKSKMMGVYSSPGVNDFQFKELQKNYELFGVLQTLINSEEFDFNTDKSLINNLIDAYRKDAREVDRFSSDFEKLLTNIKEAPDASSLHFNISKGYSYTIKEFENMNEITRLDNSETSSGQAKSSGLQRSAGSLGRFSFSFPTIEFLGNGQIRVHKKQSNYSFSLAGEDVNMIGSAFGNFENPIQKAQVILWEAFAEGSDVSKLLDYVANDSRDIVTIDSVHEETYKKIAEFYKTASIMPESLTDAIGTYGAKVIGGSKVGFDGGTTTPAAFFMGSTTATVLPKAILTRHGGGDETNRQQVHQKFINALDNFDPLNQLTESTISLNSLLEKRKSLYEYKEEITYKLSELENLRTEYLQSSEYKSHASSIQQAEDWGRLYSQTDYEKRNIKRDIKSEKSERALNLKIKQNIEEPFTETIKEINSLIKPLTAEKTQLKSDLKELISQRNEIRKSYGINKIEKNLYYLSLEKTAVDREISDLFERKHSLITEETYLEKLLTGAAPIPNVYGDDFNRKNVINQSDYLSNEITNLQNQINSLRDYKSTLTNKDKITPDREILSQGKKRFYLEERNKAARLSGLNVIENSLTYAHERIGELNLEISPLVEMKDSLKAELISARKLYNFRHLDKEISYQNEVINNLYIEKNNKKQELSQIEVISKQLSEQINQVENNSFLKEGNLEIQRLNRLTKNIKEEIKELNVKIKEANNSNFLISAANTIRDGISASATGEITRLQKASQAYQQQIESIKENENFNRLQSLNEQIKANNTPELIAERNTLRDELGITNLLNDIEGRVNPESTQTLNYYEKLIKGSRVKEGGDSFISLLGLSEMKVLRAELLKLGYTDTEVPEDKQVSKLSTYSESMKAIMSPIAGLLVGSESEVKAYLDPSELQGKMRRGASKLTDSLELNVNTLKDYEDSTALGYLKKTVDSIIKFGRDKETQLLEDHSDLVKAQGQTKFDEMYKTFDKYKQRLNSSDISRDEINDLTMIIESEVQRYHAELNLGNVQANRSSPMGSPYLGKAKYDVFGITELNNLMSGYDLPISFSPPGNVNNRNDTLQLFNPISFKVAELGDFDGDMILNMINTSSTLKLKKSAYENKVSSLQNDRYLKQSKLVSAESVADTDTVTKLTEQINKIDTRVETLNSQIVNLDATITAIQNDSGVQQYQKHAANWVGNYLKVDPNMFLGEELKGYRKRGESVPPEVLFTFTEQGRGLFGGMENLVATSAPMNSALLELTKKLADNDQAHSIDQILASSDPDNSLFTLLRDNPEIKTEIESKLNQIIQTTPDPEDYKIGVANYVTDLMAAKTGTEALQKYNSKGIEGVAMSPEAFEAMEKTLGQAGSVILGKTYNTMVGMLYTEAPNLAMSHAILRDPVLQEQFKGLVEQGKMDSQTYDDLVNAAQHSQLKAEQMGSFLQATQQILRDSIKPKQSESYLRELDAVLTDYKEAENQETRDRAFNDMVEKFGPGSGLKALIQLESLTKDLEELNNKGKDESTILKQQELMNKYGITSSKKEELQDRLGWDESTGRFSSLSGSEYDATISKNNLSGEFVLAAYKTKQDMVSIVSAFAYEKGLNENESTGKSLLQLFTDSITNPDYDQNKLKDINRLVDSAENFYLQNSRPTDKRHETEAYIDALIDRKIDNLSNLTPEERAKKEAEGYKDYSGLSTSEKQYAAHTWLTTSQQFSHTAGEHGDNLIRFGLFNRMRRDVFAGNNDRETADSFDITRDPLAVVSMLALTGGKIENQQIGKTMNVLTSAARNATGNVNPNKEDIGNQLLLSPSLSDTPSDRQMKSILIQLAQQDQSASDKIISRVLEVSESMSFGQQTDTIKAFVSSINSANDSNSEEILAKRFREEGLEDADARALASRMSTNFLKGNADPDGLLRESVRAKLESTDSSRYIKPESKATAILGVLGKDADTKSQAFIFPALGLIGAALATGEVDPEDFQQAVGMSLMNLGYVRVNNLESRATTTASNAVIGSAFKMRMALEESEGDAGKAILNMAGRELSMGLAGQLTAPIAKGFDSLLGGGATLDVDKYQSARGLVSSTLASVGSTILGMMLGNQVVSRLVSPQGNEVEAQLRAINQQRLKMTNLNDTPVEEMLEVEGDNGNLNYQQSKSWGNDLDVANLDNSENINSDYTYSFDNEPTYDFNFNV